MPTGLQVNKGFAQMGNISIQAVKSQSEDSNFGNLNVSNAAVIGANKVVSDAGNIAQNSGFGISPTINQFQTMMTTLSPIPFQLSNLAAFNINTLSLSPMLAQFLPQKLRGISEQRPEIIALTNFSSMYSGRGGNDTSDVGDFIGMSIASRKLRFDHIEALMESIQEVEDANKILQEIANDYADDVKVAEYTVGLMGKIAKTIKDIKGSLNIRKSENLKDEKVEKVSVTALSYKTFLVEEYGFSESGYANFSNTKILGQFLYDAGNTLKQYSPSLFGTNNSSPSGDVNVAGGFQISQPSINDFSFNANFSLGEAEQQGNERNADRDFGVYNTSQIDLTDGQFGFKVEYYKNASLPILGTVYNQFLDLLPGNFLDRTTLLLMSLSKEFRISSGLGQTNVKNILFNTFEGDEVGDPFDFVIGSPGDTITEPVIGKNSLCSLLRYVNNNNDIVLPFESTYVKGEDGRLYIPGSKELADSIVQSESPYDISNLMSFQSRLSNISSDAISVITKLLDGKRRSRLKPVDLFNDLGRDFIEAIDLLISNLPSDDASLPGSWGEASLLKMAISDREIKQLLFQYVLTLGMIGKPSQSQFGDSSVEPFFKTMANNELITWGALPLIAQDRDLNPTATTALNTALESFGIDTPLGSTISVITTNGDTDSLASVPTRNSVAGFAVLAFIAQTLLSRAKQKGNQIGGTVGNQASILNDSLISHLISTKNLVFLNRIADFIATITNRANDFINDGRTRFNRLSTTTIAAFAFEAYLSFIEPLMGGVSAPNVQNGITNIVFSMEELRESQSLLSLLVGNFGSFRSPTTLGGLDPQQQSTLFNAQEAAALATPAGSIKFKLLKEEGILNQIIERIRKTFNLVNNTTSNAVDFLDPLGPKAEKLMELIEVQGGRERVAMIDEAQFILARKSLRDFKSGEGLSLISKTLISFRGKAKAQKGFKYRIGNRKKYNSLFLTTRLRTKRIDIPVFVDGSVITNNEKKLMDIILGRPKFRGNKSENLKILTVGIPAGFSSNFGTEIRVTEDNANQILNKERDVISINVYRRSIDFEDIVFKPKTYLFELSRFVMKSELARTEIEPNKFRDFLNDKSIEFMRDFSDTPGGVVQSQESFFENEQYSFLSNRQKTDLIVNHIESFVLGMYLQLLTGVSTDESEFLVDESLLEGFIDDDAKQRFSDLVLTYVRGLTKEPITIEQLKNSSPQIKGLLEKIDNFKIDKSFTDQITPPKLPGTSIPLEMRIELTEDLINFVKLFSPKSLLTGGKIQALRITSPKLFERIFNLSVDPDDFEIDLEKTFATESGKRMYKTLEKMGLLQTSTKIKERNKNRTISLDQFFVNVSTAGDVV